MLPRPALLALLLAASACGSPTTPIPASDAGPALGPTLIHTAAGPIQGAVVEQTRVFLGIPYAAPPVGALRWKSPQAAPPWTAVRDATVPAPICPQISALSSTFDPASSEDCLALNVWTPEHVPAAPAPVLVWIHGGSFTFGSGTAPDYDGRKLSDATGAVVVTLNYRLGALGFLAHAALESEDAAHPSSGMYGIEDQRAALAWVNANIAAFDGDPARVTLFGESAGGLSTCAHLVSPRSAGLFERVIIESGACAFDVFYAKEPAEKQGTSLGTALACKDIACMRTKSAKDVTLALSQKLSSLAGPGVSWPPVIDGWNLLDAPPKLFAQGAVNHVPTLLGTNRDEGTLFFLSGLSVANEADFITVVERVSSGNGKKILTRYPVASFKSAQAAAIEAITDAAFVCPARRTARAMAKAGVAAYLYSFVHVPARAIDPTLGVYHTAEIPFVFGNPTFLSGPALTPDEDKLSASMKGYWGRMGGAADPNGGDAVAWPKYDEATDENIVFDLTITSESGHKKSACDFWDGLSGG